MDESQESTVIRKQIGLPNYGNTCFINTTLQILYHNVEFRQQLRLIKDQRYGFNIKKLKDIFQDIDQMKLDNLKKFGEHVVSILPSTGMGDTGDVHELLLALLELTFQRCFTGKLQEFKRQGEETVQGSVYDFNLLVIPIGQSSVKESIYNSLITKPADLILYERKIVEAPLYLTLDVLSHDIEFETELHITEHCLQPYSYSLFAVVLHPPGHYTTIIRKDEYRWIYFNDNFFEEIFN